MHEVSSSRLSGRSKQRGQIGNRGRGYFYLSVLNALVVKPGAKRVGGTSVSAEKQTCRLDVGSAAECHSSLPESSVRHVIKTPGQDLQRWGRVYRGMFVPTISAAQRGNPK